jgi:hypothetical protein
MLRNYCFEIPLQISQILENSFASHGFALCEIESLDFELALVAANQIEVLLSEHNWLSMFSTDNFFLLLWLFLGNNHFYHHFHHFLIWFQLVYFEVHFFFTSRTFGHFVFWIALDAFITETVSTTFQSIGDAVEMVKFLGAGVTVHFYLIFIKFTSHSYL